MEETPYPCVSNKHKLIFIHIPKTAGTSFVNSLGIAHSSSFHNHPEAVRKFAGYRRWNGFLKVTFVRNPLTRFVSAWLYNISQGEKGIGLKGIRKDAHRIGLDFPAFVEYAEMRWPFENDGLHFRPQSRWLTYKDGSQVEYDFVGRYERLESDVNTVWKLLGLDGISLPHARKSRSVYSDHMSYYNKHTEKVVRRLYAKDFELAGYL